MSGVGADSGAPRRAELLSDGEWAPVDLLELDSDIRRGRVPRGARLRGGPLAPDGERTLGEIPALAEAFDAPDARFAAHMREGRSAPLAMAATLLVLAAGLVQQSLALAAGLLVERGSTLAQPFLWLLGLYGRAATGFEPLIFDGAWWSPWASQLSHSGPMHLFPNLAVLGYAGYRVERAMGTTGVAVIGAAALLGGVFAVTVAQPLPVIGASILGYGLWGAQITIGFRMGEAVPVGWRAYYGYGNLFLFAVLSIGSLSGQGVSHWAHLGGFVGGVCAALWVTPPCVVPRAQEARVRRRLRWVALALAISPSLLGPPLRLIPPLAYGLPQEVNLSEAGASLQIPSRLLPQGWTPERPYSTTTHRLPAWTSSPNSEEFVFCGLVELDWVQVRDGDPLVGDELARFWSRLAGEGAKARAIQAPDARAPGWTAHALEFLDAEGVPRYRLVEHHLLRGRLLNRLGYVVALDKKGRTNPREGLFQRVLDSAVVGEPPALAYARDEHARNPSSERLRYQLALALYDVGDLAQADALLELILLGGGPLTQTAVISRVELWAQFPQAFADAPRPAWFEPWMDEYPQARTLQISGVRWLAAVGRCDEARARHEAYAAAFPDAVELLETAQAVIRCEGGGR